MRHALALAASVLAASVAVDGGDRPCPAPERSWAVRAADALLARGPVVHPRWDYTAGLALLALDRLGTPGGDARYRTYVKDNVDRLVQADGTIDTYDMEEFNLDQINEGRLLFALYDRTHDERYRKAAGHLREQLRRHPRTAEGGFWHKKIYPHQMWLDGLYMAEPFYAEWAAREGEPEAFDDVARQILLATRHTRDAKTGLFRHGWDESRSDVWADRTTGQSPQLWGRGVGWLAMALVDVLEYLPASHKDRPELVRTLADLADALVRVQDRETGLWYQVLDQPERAGNYLETSASAMFAYALARGVTQGHLPERFRSAAGRAHDRLVQHRVTIGEDGCLSLAGICQVAGLGGRQHRDGSFAYYMSEPVVSDDLKGVGPFILASLELGR
jgi:unsaturated rhamnogalacturonyl hydrolase